jgi:hypothetical protein
LIFLARVTGDTKPTKSLVQEVAASEDQRTRHYECNLRVFIHPDSASEDEQEPTDEKQENIKVFVMPKAPAEAPDGETNRSCKKHSLNAVSGENAQSHQRQNTDE